MRHIIVAILGLLLFTSPILTQGAEAGGNAPAKNPFGVTVPGGAPSPATRPAQELSLFAKFYIWVRDTQRDLHRQLAKSVREIKTHGTLEASLGLIILSFIYGVVHAAGPGHGKAVISSYVLANERTMRRGIVLALLASLVQACTAIAIVTVIAAILNYSGRFISSVESYLESASYALVALVGAWLLVSVIRSAFFKKSSSHVHHHDEHHHHHDHSHAHHDHEHHHHGPDDAACEVCGHNHLPDPKELEDNWSLQKAAAIIFAIGIRPCSGAVIVLVFALAQGLFWAGVLATFAMSVGTAITVSALAVLAVGSKNVALNLAGGNAIWVDRVYLTLAFLGASLVLVIGVMLFVASLGPARPF